MCGRNGDVTANLILGKCSKTRVPFVGFPSTGEKRGATGGELHVARYGILGQHLARSGISTSKGCLYAHY